MADVPPVKCAIYARVSTQGRILGRPRNQVDLEDIILLRRRGLSQEQIAAQVGVSRSTISRLLRSAKTDQKPSSGST